MKNCENCPIKDVCIQSIVSKTCPVRGKGKKNK